MPLKEGAHEYQIEAPPSLAAWSGSPNSLVPYRFDPACGLVSGLSEVASAKSSLGGGSASKAPMSQAKRSGRSTPRWSWSSTTPFSSLQPAGLPPSSAGLLGNSARVSVG